MLSEKLNMAPQVQMKFDFSAGGFMIPAATSANASTSPAGSPFETTSPMPLLLPHSPIALPQLAPSSLPLSFLTVPSLMSTAASPFFTAPLMYGAAPTLFPNPLLMTPIGMQMLFQNFQNFQNIRELSAAISCAETD